MKRVDMPNAFDASNLGGVTPRTRELIRRRTELLGPAYRLFYETPVEFVRGEGVWLYDPDENAYLDAYNNVPSVGHSHPGVAAAVSRQVARLNTHTRYPAAPILDYAERLLATHAPEIEQVMFTCTGSEAVDLALRISRSYSGGRGIVVSDNAYHGISSACAGISPNLAGPSGLDASTRTVRVPLASSNPSSREADDLLRDIALAIDDLERSGAGFAGFVADSVFSSDGLRAEPMGVLAAAADLVRSRGGLYIADEVQAGFGRTGESMWGYRRHGLEPDLVVMGKPMGNGMPIAAVAAKPALLEAFGEKMRYFNTFGGNPVCVAAATAVLDALEGERLLQNSEVIGADLKERLAGLAEGFEFLGDVRGVGLFLALDVTSSDGRAVPDPKTASRIVNGLFDRRVMVGLTGPHASTLKIRPPLPFGSIEVDEFINRLDATCRSIADEPDLK